MKTILGWWSYNLPKCNQTSYINIWAKRARSNFLGRDASRCQNRFAVGKQQLVWKLYTLFLFLSKVNFGGWWLLTTAGKQSIKVWLNWRCVKTATVCIGSAIERDRTQAAIRECLKRTSRRTRSAKPFIGESRSPQRCYGKSCQRLTNFGKLRWSGQYHPAISWGRIGLRSD